MKKCISMGCDSIVQGDPKKYSRCGKCHNNLRSYGITTPERDNILSEQNGKCLICFDRIEFSGMGRYSEVSEYTKAVVDHCHSRGERNIRGIICTHCNRGLGGFKDNPDSLERAIRYLKEVS